MMSVVYRLAVTVPIAIVCYSFDYIDSYNSTDRKCCGTILQLITPLLLIQYHHTMVRCTQYYSVSTDYNESKVYGIEEPTVTIECICIDESCSLTQ